MGEPRFVSRGAVDENGRLSVSAKNFVGPKHPLTNNRI
jgi:hypothetical protein